MLIPGGAVLVDEQALHSTDVPAGRKAVAVSGGPSASLGEQSRKRWVFRGVSARRGASSRQGDLASGSIAGLQVGPAAAALVAAL